MNQYTITGELNSFQFMTAGSGYFLTSWQTAPGDYKNGGVFADSVLTDGRRPVFRQESNDIDTVKFGIYGSSPDQVALLLQNLQAECETAFDYWRPSSIIATPVYLTAQVSTESDTRYAWIYKIRIENIPDLYNGEFQSGILVNGAPYACGIANLTLTIERTPWLSHSPGNGDDLTITTYEDNLVYAAHVPGTYAACVQVDSTEILGDLDALGQIKLANSAQVSDRIIGGIRSTSRGANFVAYFNFTDPSLSPTVYTPGGTPVVDADAFAGEAMQVSWIPASSWDGQWNQSGVPAISILDMEQFRGRYRAFLRIKATSSLTGKIALQVYHGLASTLVRNIANFNINTAVTDIAELDLGEITIPVSDQWSLPGTTRTLTLRLWLWPDQDTGTINFHELVIIPIDEYVFDATFEIGNTSGQDLHVDSVTYPRTKTQCVSFINSTQQLYTLPTLVQSHPFVRFPVGRTFKIWFYAPNVTTYDSPGIKATPTLKAICRYKHLRGNT